MKEKLYKNIRSTYSRILFSKYMSISFGIILLLISIFMWKITETRNLSLLLKNLESTSGVFMSDIEGTIESIEYALDDISQKSPPDSIIEERDWDRYASFYVENYDGLNTIALIGKDLRVQRMMPVEGKRFTVNDKVAEFLDCEDCIDVLLPVESEEDFHGFIYAAVSLPDMILSLGDGFEEEFMIKVSDENGIATTSSDWKEPKTDIGVIQHINYLNEKYVFTMVPTDMMLKKSKSSSYQLLVFGLSLSVLAAGLLLFLQKFMKESIALSKTKTELQTINERLEVQLSDQDRLSSIGTIASGIAHEINNPITGIMNYSQLILDLSPDKSENATYAEEIIVETKRVSNLVKNLLQFSRHGRAGFSNARITDIVNPVINLMGTISKKDQIEIKVSFDNESVFIKCNSQQIQQVLMNLMSNARDALNEKYEGYHKDKIINVSCSFEQTEYIRITVEDFGGGILESVQEKIFSQFYTTKEAGKGTGLGLYICMNIVRHHGGRLSFETEQGKYTKFFLDLPLNSDN